MEIEIIPAERDDETAFRNLYQFYIYDFSRFMGWRTNYAGRFNEDDMDGCWTDPKRNPYLFKIRNMLAGLAIVDHQDRSNFTDTAPVIYLAEFFIMGAFQGKGYGEKAACQLFDLYKGNWELSELKDNVNAQHFWRKVVGRYTDGNYQEIITPKGHFVQAFVTS